MSLTETAPATVQEVSKSQAIRLVDVAIIAPACVASGIILFRNEYPVLGVSMVAIGIATAVYNGNNFIVNYKKPKQ